MLARTPFTEVEIEGIGTYRLPMARPTAQAPPW